VPLLAFLATLTRMQIKELCLSVADLDLCGRDDTTYLDAGRPLDK